MTISQSGGTGLVANIAQQTGGSNQATTNQTGYYNTATINQVASSFGSTANITQAGAGNQATITQFDFLAFNTATVAQNGYSNQATIDQTLGSNDRATINQDLSSTGGSGNMAAIKQGSATIGDFSNNNVATITQNYSYNQARLEQAGNNNRGTLTQTGDFNIIQNGTGTAGSFAQQLGNSNTLTVLQDSGGAAPYVPNVANVNQMGNGNAATINQTGRF